MTEEQIAGLAPALGSYLGEFNGCFAGRPARRLLGQYSRGLLSDLARKSVEPMALACGAAVRTLQEFLTHSRWGELQMRDLLQQRIVQKHLPVPGEATVPGPGVMAWIDETSFAKKGTKTPGVQRQHCGETGKIDNCVVSVHLAVGYDGFTTIVDSELYLPQSWAEDAQRRREAHIPEDMIFRTKCLIALGQLQRAIANGMRFDWIGFDEGYGGKPWFLMEVERLGQRFIGEVPKSFACFGVYPRYDSTHRCYSAKTVENVARYGKALKGKTPARYRVVHKTVGDSVWEVKAGRVYLSVEGKPTQRMYWLIAARNVGTGERKYFVSNAPERTSVKRMLEAAFSRWQIEHLFRVAKTEIGLGHYEGRHYRGLMRHQILCQLLLLFLAEQTDRLRGEKSTVDQGAGGQGAQRRLSGLAAAEAPHRPPRPRRTRHPLPSAAQSSGYPVPEASNSETVVAL